MFGTIMKLCGHLTLHSSSQDQEKSKMRAVLASVLFAAALSLCTAQENVVWYISDGPTSSPDITRCGKTIDTPCTNLSVIVEDSPLFVNSTGSCRQATGNLDGRNSTTLYFLEGIHFVEPICLTSWTNLRIMGLGGLVTVTSRNGGVNGLFQLQHCTDVTISNVNFDTAIFGKSTLFFQNCRDVLITNSAFSLDASNSRGVDLIQCEGDLTISQSTFTGNPALHNISDNQVNGLAVIHGTNCGFTPCSSTVQPFQLRVSDTVFNFVTSGIEGDDSYQGARSQGNVLRVRFVQDSINNRAIFDNITVTNSLSLGGSAVLINFDTGSSGNTAIFRNSKFVGNRVRYGGGVAGYFYSRPDSSFLGIEDCVFESNIADFEGGGIFAVFLASDVSNSMQIARSTFNSNNASVGAGVYLLSNPFWFEQRGIFDPVSPAIVHVNLTDCNFVGNNAQFKEGVVNVLRILLTVDGVSMFANNTGSAVILRLSLAFFSGRVSFIDNMADSGAALNIRHGSRVDMSAVTEGLFNGNKATFAGGAIFADDASTSKLAVEYNHTVADSIFGACFLMLGNEPLTVSPPPAPRRFTFIENTAVREGQSISSFSLRGCTLANFVPNITAQYLHIQGDGTIYYADPSILDNTSTGPSNLFFFGASTKCYKTVADVTYLLPNCSHELLNETFQFIPELNCGLDALFNNDLSVIYTPGTGLRPPIDKLYFPWASIDATWTLTPSSRRARCEETDPANLVLSPAPGEKFDLTIQLADQLLNYISYTIYLDVLHDLNSDPPGVLLQLNGIQYAYNDRVYFTPNRVLSGLAIVGLPGTAGKIRVVADSQVKGETIQLLIPFQLSQCPLGYFNPTGATTLKEVNELILTNFSSTQRIPPDQPLACQCFIYRNNSRSPFRVADSPSTECLAGYTVQLSSVYWAGRTPMATGSSPSRQVPCPGRPSVLPVVDDEGYTVWVQDSRRTDETNGISAGFDPVDVVQGQNGVIPGGGAPIVCYNTSNVSELVEYMPPGEFTIDVCTRGYCRGDASSSWFLSNVDYPCIENREGVLCGQCRPGFAVTLYTTICYDCRGKVWEGVIALFTTLICGVLLVMLSIAFKLGVSPTVDSMLFFIQSVLILLSGRTDYSIYTYYLPFFNPDFTFNLCISPDLTAYGRLLLQFVTPVYMILLLAIVILLTKYTRLGPFLGKHSFLQGIWLLFLLSYFNISITSFELLHCRETISVERGVSQYLLSHDASVQCFVGAHLPAGIVAIVLVAFVILPMPIYLLLLSYGIFGSRLKPVTDVYCSPYKDARRWWITFSVLRRLLLVVVGVFIQDYIWRHFSLFLGLGLIQIFYVATWPYKTRTDNYFGFVVGWVLLFVGLITQPALYLSVDVERAISMTTVVATIFVSIGLIVLEIALRRRDMSVGQCLERVYLEVRNCYMNCLTSVRSKRASADIQELEESTSSNLSTVMPKHSTVDATTYREPLLDSMYTSHDTSINTTGRDSRLKDSLEKTRKWRVTRKPRRSKMEESIEAMPGSSNYNGTSMTVEIPTHEDGARYRDSGIAATYVSPSD